MEFWNSIGKIFSFITKKGCDSNILQKLGIYRHVNKDVIVDKKVSKKEFKKQSAISKGRMRKTDQIKGRSTVPLKCIG